MIPIEDGYIKVPDVVDCASVRVVYPDGAKTTIPYVRKQPLEVVDGTVLQFLTGGTQVMCETRCDAPVTLLYKGEAPEITPLKEEDLQNLRIKRAWDA